MLPSGEREGAEKNRCYDAYFFRTFAPPELKQKVMSTARACERWDPKFGPGAAFGANIRKTRFANRLEWLFQS
jgi:hypothetical protein